MSDYVISTYGLTKFYGSREVVSGLDLNIERGSVFGFLGRNGAGKTTTIRMLLGLVAPTRGSSEVLGYDSQYLTPEARARIGYLAEGHNVYDWMNVQECHDYQAAFYSKWNESVFWGVIDHFRLKTKAKAGDLSRGERAGLCLALTLAPEPDLLILDDPALGLDPVARRSLLQSMIYVTRAADKTILFSSHLLADVERVADSIGIMESGVLRAHCSVDTFRDQVCQITLYFAGKAPTASNLPGLIDSLRTDNELELTFANYTEESAKAIDELMPDRIEYNPTNLEDAFISYIGERKERTLFLSNTEGTR
jgi:ABC-2 type transport system ATP-binding protein